MHSSSLTSLSPVVAGTLLRRMYCPQDICKKYNIPTAAYESFTDPEAAKQYIRQQGAPIVVKTSGLAAGKGVIVAATVEDACQAVDDMMVNAVFGDAGACVVYASAQGQGEEWIWEWDRPLSKVRSCCRVDVGSSCHHDCRPFECFSRSHPQLSPPQACHPCLPAPIRICRSYTRLAIKSHTPGLEHSCIWLPAQLLEYRASLTAYGPAPLLPDALLSWSWSCPCQVLRLWLRSSLMVRRRRSLRCWMGSQLCH